MTKNSQKKINYQKKWKNWELRQQPFCTNFWIQNAAIHLIRLHVNTFFSVLTNLYLRAHCNSYGRRKKRINRHCVRFCTSVVKWLVLEQCLISSTVLIWIIQNASYMILIALSSRNSRCSVRVIFEGGPWGPDSLQNFFDPGIDCIFIVRTHH